MPAPRSAAADGPSGDDDHPEAWDLGAAPADAFGPPATGAGTPAPVFAPQSPGQLSIAAEVDIVPSRRGWIGRRLPRNRAGTPADTTTKRVPGVSVSAPAAVPGASVPARAAVPAVGAWSAQLDPGGPGGPIAAPAGPDSGGFTSAASSGDNDPGTGPDLAPDATAAPSPDLLGEFGDDAALRPTMPIQPVALTVIPNRGRPGPRFRSR